MMSGSCTHFVLSAGYGGGDGSGSSNYNRDRDDYSNHNRGRSEYNRGRNDYYNDNSSGGYGGNGPRMETQRDTIFIQNLPRNVTSDELRDVFSQIGVIKVKRNIRLQV